MKTKAFLDTNIFLYSVQYPNSNSKTILELLKDEKFIAFISELVLKETTRYLERNYGHKAAIKLRRFMVQFCFVVPSFILDKEIRMLKGKVAEKDVEQLAVVKHFNITCLVSYDRDFDKIAEYVKPKEFVALFGMKPKNTPY